MKLLLSGFEAFGGSTINPSEQVVYRLAQSIFDDVELMTVVLPVDRLSGPDTLIRSYISAQPDMVLSLGEAGGITAVHIERVAINLLNFTIPDNSGALVTDKAIIGDGPAAYFATLPTRMMLNTLTENEFPARLSYSAGTYLCNQVMYELLHYIHRHQLTTPAGFMHLPQLPEQVAANTPPAPSMSLESMTAAVTAVIHTLAASIVTP